MPDQAVSVWLDCPCLPFRGGHLMWQCVIRHVQVALPLMLHASLPWAPADLPAIKAWGPVASLSRCCVCSTVQHSFCMHTCGADPGIQPVRSGAKQDCGPKHAPSYRMTCRPVWISYCISNCMRGTCRHASAVKYWALQGGMKHDDGFRV